MDCEFTERLIRELEAHRLYARALCKAVDAATDFAGTVAGGASWWDDVWADHAAALDRARANISAASGEDAKQIINAVLLKQRDHHCGECADDRYARDVCDGMWEEKCDDVIALCEALRAVLALAGENKEVRAIVEKAISDHGGPEAP